MDSINFIPLKDMPQSADAERAILGSALLDQNAMHELTSKIKAEYFAFETHEELYKIFEGFHQKRMPVDVVAVIEESLRLKVFDVADSAREYLKTLMYSGVNHKNVHIYLEILEKKYKLRALLKAVNGAKDRIIEGGDFEEIADELERKLRLVRAGETAAGYDPVSQTVGDFLENPFESDAKIMSTGYEYLDAFLKIRPGNLIIVAGRPGMGKTTLMINMARNIAERRAGKTAAIFSLEMSREEIALKVLQAETGKPLRDIKNSLKTGIGKTAVYEAGKALENLRLGTIEGGSITPQKIRAMVRKIKDAGIIFIDYLGLMSSNDPKRQVTEAVRIAEITRELKQIAKEFEIPVVLGCQLNRGVENRADKRPNLSDLRDSGGIEQDADAVIMLYREDYYDPEFEPKGATEVIIAKNRMGSTGTIGLMFNLETSKVTSAEFERA
jgi:replicative DNA helicase